MKPPIAEKIPALRQRRRTDGTWRIWWEATPLARDLGFSTVDLDADRLSWSVRRAKQLNADLARARGGDATARTAPGGRTVTDLAQIYRASSAFRALAPDTQRSYISALNLIERKWGQSAVAEFTKPVLYAWYETLVEASGPWQAKSLIRHFSILFSHAELIGWRPENSNPAFRLKMKQPKGRARVSAWEELDALTAAADALDLPAMALAILLSALQGQRQTDVRLARKQDFSQVTLPAAEDQPQETIWVWRWTRSKRQNAGIAPIHAEVAPRLEAQLAATKHLVEWPELLIDPRTGRPMLSGLFQDRWDQIRAKAAEDVPTVATLQFRDLRRTFGNLARAGGASKSDTADVLGNSAANNDQLAEIYMSPQLATARRAVDAIRRPATRKRA